MSIFDLFKKRVLTQADYEEIFKKEWFPRVKCDDSFSEGMDDVLRAIFSPYSEAHISLNTPLNGAECSFNYTEDWSYNVDVLRGQIYECYLNICREFNIHPIELGDINKYKNVPYISYKELIESSKITSICFLHLRDMQVKYISSLPIYPSDEEIMNALERIREKDSGIHSFLLTMISISISIQSNIIDYCDLYTAYNEYVLGFLGMVYHKDAKTIDDIFRKAKSIFEEKLGPYTQRLKEVSAISESWEFSYSEMCLTTVPYQKKWGEDIFMKVCRLWNEPKMRYNASLYKKVFETLDDPNAKDGDVVQSLYEYEMHQKKYFPNEDK